MEVVLWRMEVVLWPMTFCKCTFVFSVKLSRSAGLYDDSNIHAPAIVVNLHLHFSACVSVEQA